MSVGRVTECAHLECKVPQSQLVVRPGSRDGRALMRRPLDGSDGVLCKRAGLGWRWQAGEGAAVGLWCCGTVAPNCGGHIERMALFSLSSEETLHSRVRGTLCLQPSLLLAPALAIHVPHNSRSQLQLYIYHHMACTPCPDVPRGLQTREACQWLGVTCSEALGST